VLNKMDLLPLVEFNVDEFRRLVRSLNPDINIFEVSCSNDEGLDRWAEWLIELTPDK